MRSDVDTSKLEALLQALGRAARSPGRVYLTGGASALLVGWRQATVDVDMRLDPEPQGIFEAIRDLKIRLDVNVELASPQDFLPELPGWQDRSVFIRTEGRVDFYHYDFYAQALSKLERGHDRDVSDVAAMVERGLVEPQKLRELLQRIEDRLIRFPRVDPARLAANVEALCDD